MTPLNRAVVRQTNEIDARTGKPLVVRLEVGGRLVKIRPKGDQQWYSVTYAQIAVMGARNAAAVIRARKLAEREAARKERECQRKASRRATAGKS